MRSVAPVVASLCVALAGAHAARAQSGPSIRLFGLLDPGGNILLPEDGVYLSATGTGFLIVVEAARGPGGPVGLNLFDPVVGPDLQVQVSQGLGNESPEVCGVFQDGVPASGTGDFNPTPQVIAALNRIGRSTAGS
jgi:hypothetical protein